MFSRSNLLSSVVLLYFSCKMLMVETIGDVGFISEVGCSRISCIWKDAKKFYKFSLKKPLSFSTSLIWSQTTNSWCPLANSCSYSGSFCSYVSWSELLLLQLSEKVQLKLNLGSLSSSLSAEFALSPWVSLASSHIWSLKAWDFLSSFEQERRGDGAYELGYVVFNSYKFRLSSMLSFSLFFCYLMS